MLYIVVIFQNPTSNVTVSPQTVCISFPKKYYMVWIGTVRDSETASLCNEASKFIRKSKLFEYYVSKSTLFESTIFESTLYESILFESMAALFESTVFESTLFTPGWWSYQPQIPGTS